MCKAKDTLLRQLALLLAIPQGAQRRAITILLEKLREDGLSVGLRTPPRDLESLSAPFTLKCDSPETPCRWSFARNALVNLVSMDTSMALAFFLAEIDLKSFLLRIVLSHLSPQLNRDRSYYIGTVDGCSDVCPSADRPRDAVVGVWPARKVQVHAPASGRTRFRIEPMKFGRCMGRGDLWAF